MKYFLKSMKAMGAAIVLSGSSLALSQASSLAGLLDLVENGELSLEREGSLFVEDVAQDVPPLDDCDRLLDHVLGRPVEDHLEEAGVVVQLYENNFGQITYKFIRTYETMFVNML